MMQPSSDKGMNREETLTDDDNDRALTVRIIQNSKRAVAIGEERLRERRYWLRLRIQVIGQILSRDSDAGSDEISSVDVYDEVDKIKAELQEIDQEGQD